MRERRKVLRVDSSDGKVNVSYETHAAFFAKGVSDDVGSFSHGSDPEPAGSAIEPMGPAQVPSGGRSRPRRPREALSADDVKMMLADADAWRLLVRYDGSDGMGVLERVRLEEAWTKGHDNLRLRDLTADERRVVSEGELGSESRLDEVAGWPLGGLSLVGLALTGFGILKEPIEIARDWLAWATIILLLITIPLAAVARYGRKSVRIRRSRLDLLERRMRPTRAETLVPWILIGCFVTAIVCAVGAVFPAADAAGQNATIGKAQISTAANGTRTVTIQVSWANLGDAVKEVRSRAELGEQRLDQEESPKESDGTAAHKLKVTLSNPGLTEIRITTEALDAGRKSVGDTESRTLEIP